jgi:hypothetical protein
MSTDAYESHASLAGVTLARPRRRRPVAARMAVGFMTAAVRVCVDRDDLVPELRGCPHDVRH